MSLFRLGRVVFRSVLRRVEVLREVPYSKANQVALHSNQTKVVAHYGQHGGLVSAPNTTRSSFLTSTLTRAAYQGFVQGRSSLITNYGSIFKGNAIFRLMKKGEIQGPLFAFLGFVCSADLNVKTNECREEEEDFQRLYQWMQQGLQSSQKEKSLNSQQDHKNLQLSDYKITDRLGKPSSNSAVYKANRNNEKLAVKMLFNFSSSKTYDITKKFSKEQEVLGIFNKEGEEQSEDSSYIRATPHFNILPVLHSFLDSVPCLPDAKESYPAALPSRHDPSGFGRNRTMFIITPRMDCTVEEYIASHTLDTRTSTLLLLQLMNGISHLSTLGIAHRDLKTDNLLLDISTLGCPRLLICDFGCCLAEKRLWMKLPFVTQETDRGGNLALMAPEVVTAQPGNGVVIDYSNSDAWAAGAIAYELFGSPNPFGRERLDSSLYEETDLPPLENAIGAVRWVVSNLLRRKQHERLSAAQAVTILYVFLFAPAWWLRDRFLVTQGVVLRWLLEGSTKMLAVRAQEKKIMSVEEMLQLMFLSRACVEEVIDAVAVVRSVQNNYRVAEEIEASEKF